VTGTTTLVTEAMRGVVGATISRRVSFPVSASDIRKWAIAVYHPHQPPPRFWDATVTGGRLIAPHEFNPFAWMTAEPKGFPAIDRLDADILEKTLGIEGPGLTRQLNGGLEVEYLEDLGEGDVVTAVRVLDEYRERDGRLGRMLFTTVQETWTDQRGRTLQIRRQTGIRY
jgi:hypothetical protein